MDTTHHSGTQAAPSRKAGWPELTRAQALPVLALLVFGALFMRHLGTLDGQAIWAGLRAVSIPQWVAALGFTALSFWTIGWYDVLVHRMLRTGHPQQAARKAGVKAIALSQTLGFGIITSAAVRWWSLPGLSVSRNLRFSTIVSLSFLAALAVVTAVIVPFSGLLTNTGALAATGLAAFASLIVLSHLAFKQAWLPARVSATSVVALLIVTAADTAVAAAALWVLWPDAVSFDLLFAAYLVALGSGLLSNAPGGIGALDLTLLALLPVSDDAAAMAGSSGVSCHLLRRSGHLGRRNPAARPGRGYVPVPHPPRTGLGPSNGCGACRLGAAGADLAVLGGGCDSWRFANVGFGVRLAPPGAPQGAL